MQAPDESKLETVFGITAVTTAGGVLTFALFPLVLPGVVLLGVLALPLLPLALLGAIGYGAYKIVRSIARRSLPSARPTPGRGRAGHRRVVTPHGG